MTSFMHKLAEGLRTREQYLEDHSDHPVFEAEEGNGFKQQYDDLVTECKEFSGRVEKLAAAGKEYDEHFERQICDEDRKISIKIDAWMKKLES
ncbi:MAG: hypothetical protein JKY45_05345 [Emcibacter sp.]|nr:hypothetical protein [Emcibacter sp.]